MRLIKGNPGQSCYKILILYSACIFLSSYSIAVSDIHAAFYNDYADVSSSLTSNGHDAFAHFLERTYLFKELADPLFLAPALLVPVLINSAVSMAVGKRLLSNRYLPYYLLSQILSLMVKTAELSSLQQVLGDDHSKVQLSGLPPVISRRLLIEFDRNAPGWNLYPVPVNPVSARGYQRLPPFVQAVCQLWELLLEHDVSELQLRYFSTAEHTEVTLKTGQLPTVSVVLAGCGQSSLEALLEKPVPWLPEWMGFVPGVTAENNGQEDFNCSLLGTVYLRVFKDALECVASSICSESRLVVKNGRHYYSPEEYSPEKKTTVDEYSSFFMKDMEDIESLSGSYLKGISLGEESGWLIRIKGSDGWLKPGPEALLYQPAWKAPENIVQAFDWYGCAELLLLNPDYFIVPAYMGKRLVQIAASVAAWSWYSKWEDKWEDKWLDIHNPLLAEEDYGKALVPVELASFNHWELSSPLARHWRSGVPVGHEHELVPTGPEALNHWRRLSPLASAFLDAVGPLWINRHLQATDRIRQYGGGTSGEGSSSDKSLPSDPSSSGSASRDNPPAEQSPEGADHQKPEDTGSAGDQNGDNPYDRKPDSDSASAQARASLKRKSPFAPPEPRKQARQENSAEDLQDSVRVMLVKARHLSGQINRAKFEISEQLRESQRHVQTQAREEMTALVTKYRLLKSALSKKNASIRDLLATIDEKEQKEKKVQAQLLELNAQIDEKEQKEKKVQAQLLELNAQIIKRFAEFDLIIKERNKALQEAGQLKAQIAEKEEELTHLRHRLSAQSERLVPAPSATSRTNDVGQNPVPENAVVTTKKSPVSPPASTARKLLSNTSRLKNPARPSAHPGRSAAFNIDSFRQTFEKIEENNRFRPAVRALAGEPFPILPELQEIPQAWSTKLIRYVGYKMLKKTEFLDVATLRLLKPERDEYYTALGDYIASLRSGDSRLASNWGGEGTLPVPRNGVFQTGFNAEWTTKHVTFMRWQKYKPDYQIHPELISEFFKAINPEKVQDDYNLLIRDYIMLKLGTTLGPPFDLALNVTHANFTRIVDTIKRTKAVLPKVVNGKVFSFEDWTLEAVITFLRLYGIEITEGRSAGQQKLLETPKAHTYTSSEVDALTADASSPSGSPMLKGLLQR